MEPVDDRGCLGGGLFDPLNFAPAMGHERSGQRLDVFDAGRDVHLLHALRPAAGDSFRGSGRRGRFRRRRVRKNRRSVAAKRHHDANGYAHRPAQWHGRLRRPVVHCRFVFLPQRDPVIRRPGGAAVAKPGELLRREQRRLGRPARRAAIDRRTADPRDAPPRRNARRGRPAVRRQRRLQRQSDRFERGHLVPRIRGANRQAGRRVIPVRARAVYRRVGASG